MLIIATSQDQYKDGVKQNMTKYLINGPVSFAHELLKALACPILKVWILRRGIKHSPGMHFFFLLLSRHVTDLKYETVFLVTRPLSIMK